MKRLLMIVLAVCIAFSSCAKSGKEDDYSHSNDIDNDITTTVETPEKSDYPPMSQSQKELEEFRSTIKEANSLLGIAYLGYNDSTFSDVKGYLNSIGINRDYPFLKDIEISSFFITDGGELYAIVPASDAISVSIYTATLNEDDFSLQKETKLGTVSDGSPFFIRGNVSEIMPNIILEIENNGSNVIDYSPCLSGMDGSVVTTEGVYDFSPYDAIRDYFELESPDSFLCDNWFCDFSISETEFRTLILGLYSDGEASYEIGIGNSELLESFEGTWTYNDESCLLTIVLTSVPVEPPLGTDTNGLAFEPTTFSSTLKAELVTKDNSRCLILTHVAGDTLYDDTKGTSFDFFPIELY